MALSCQNKNYFVLINLKSHRCQFRLHFWRFSVFRIIAGPHITAEISRVLNVVHHVRVN